MKLKDKYKNDIAIIMSKRHVNGADLWAGPDDNIGKGSPFSTRDVSLMLIELGFNKKDTIIQNLAELIFGHQQTDGRFRISKSGAIYPCHTIGCLRVLCYLGYAKDKRLKKRLSIYSQLKKMMEGGSVINSVLAKGRKRNILILGRLWKH